MKYTLQIPKPCHENWNNMTPTQKGKFCDVCEKEVFDFTKTSNYTLAKRLDNNKNICGRYKKSQIGTELDSFESFNFSRFAAIFSLTTLFTISTPAFAQGEVKMGKVVKTDVSYKSILKNNIAKKIKDSIIIKGVVSDSLGEISDINISIKGTENETFTNFDGEFSISISNEQLNGKDPILVFSHPSYNKQEIIIKSPSIKLIIAMEDYPELLGEIVITKKRTIFQRFGDFFKPKRSCNK